MTSPSKLKGTKLSANNNNNLAVVGENNTTLRLSGSSIRLILILLAIILFGMFSMIHTHSKLIENDGRTMAVSDNSLQSFAPPTREKFSLLDRRQQKELQRWPATSKNSTLVREKITTRDILQRAAQQQQSRQSVISDERHTQKANGMHLCTCLNPDNTQPTQSIPSKPKRIRWLHIPKTGTSFISTLWSYTSSTTNRYIDLNVNSHSCSMFDNTSYSMYDFVLMKRYPWEMYGALNMIPNITTKMLSVDIPLGLVGGTQHAALAHDLDDESYISTPHYQRVKHSKMIRKWGSEISNNITIASFFRQPEDRILSAYYDGRHSNGFTPELYKGLVDASYQRNPTTKHSCTINNSNKTYHNPLECFARYPGIAGCMTRMLSGETCADGILQENGIENLQMALDVILNHLDFVGLTEEWNESICQFHRLFGGKKKNHDSTDTLYWDTPLQGEFSNVHKSTKQKIFTTKHLNGFQDHADRAVYEAVKYKFNQMVGTNKCHRYMTWDELRNDKEGIIERHGLKLDKDGNICKPKSCVELGKQCGEWSDGCGKTIICGMCNVGRTGLPSTWRVQCSEDGQCIDYCSPWKQKGYWFVLDDSPPEMKEVITVINKPIDQTYLTPVDAILICDKACNESSSSSSFQHFIDAGLCKCGTTPKILNKNFTIQDFSKAHDLTTMCGTNKVRNGAFLLENETQPICCPPGLTQKSALTKELKGKGWVRLFSMGSFNKEGEYFDHVLIECGAFEECEEVAREKKAEMAVFDMFNSMCYLARNVVDLKDWYTVTKDNQYRHAIDLRQG